MRFEIVEEYLSRLECALTEKGLISARLIKEARDHLIDATEEGLQRGLSADAAQREAVIRFGVPETIAAQLAMERRAMRNRFHHILPWNGRRFVRSATGALIVALFLVVTSFLGISWLIESSVQAATQTALRDRPGDAVLALIEYVDSPKHMLRERNRAVWALGRLGDARALPVLERHFTGGVCDHSRALCQYELRKALRLCRGATNLPALVWR